MQKTHLNIIPTGGYIPDLPDPRNYSYGAVFGVDIYPRKLVREIPPINIPYQGRVPSCVLCSYTYLNQYKSFINENGSILNLSWRRPFSRTGAYNVGRNLSDVARYLQAAGQPQDQYCEDNPDLPEVDFMNPIMTQEGLEDEIKRVIGNHWFIRPDNPGEFYSALAKEPLIITLGGVNKDWVKPYNEIITATPGVGMDWYHALVALDYDLDAGYIRVMNWWGDGIRKLSINYLLTASLSFLDIPDQKDMLRVVKTADKQDNWVVSGNTRFRIPDADTFHYMKGQLGIIGDPVTVPVAELAVLIIGETLPSVKLMRALAPVVKDIFLEE